MAERARRRISAVRTALIVGIGGVLAGVGVGRGATAPPIALDAAHGNTLTINGKHISDGSIRYRSVNAADFEKQLGRRFATESEVAAKFEKWPKSLETHFLKIDGVAADSAKLGGSPASDWWKVVDGEAAIQKLSTVYLKLDAVAADSAKLGGSPAAGFTKGAATVVNGSRSVTTESETLLDLPSLITIAARSTGQPGAVTGIAVSLTNHASAPLRCTVFDGKSTTAVTVDPTGSTDVTRDFGGAQALHLTLQCAGGTADGTPVHTFELSALPAGGETQVLLTGITANG